MNETIVSEINSVDRGEVVAEEKLLTTWLVCMICGKKYAIRSAEVLEIIRDVSVYRLPFMPPYVEGLINRRGDPFTVINPLALTGDSSETQEPPKEPLFLILKRTDDQISFHISDILFFMEVDENDMNMIPGTNEDRFFLGTIDYGEEQIPAFNPDAFEELLGKDLGNV